ncbi:hypothetical protein AAE478_007952 [Parahypoxylon ruwenzoriense]
MPLKILVIGAGVCGPAFATFVRRSNPKHSITVVERYAGIRHNGLQIDLRSWGVPIIQRLGLEDAVREKVVDESGIAFVDNAGRVHAVFGVNKSGTGQQSFTSEFEIMRGDIVQVLYEASLKEPAASGAGAGQGEGRGRGGGKVDAEYPPGVRYEFKNSVDALAQDEKGVDVTFSDGTSRRYDLVVGADGQWSRTRRMMFGDEAGLASFKPLHMYIAYFQIPRRPEDDGLARFYHAGRGRCVMTRAGDRPYTQVYLMIRTASELVRRSIEKQPVEQQKDVFEEMFRGAGWQTEHFLEEMRKATDFYAQALGQVRQPSAVKGRIALLGDAAHCASPVSGMGTTVSLTGAYVLAGELARHREEDVALALEAYDANVRPYIQEAQKLLPGIPGVMLLESWWAITLFHLVVRFVALLRIDKILLKIVPEDGTSIQLPEYPELKLAPLPS